MKEKAIAAALAALAIFGAAPSASARHLAEEYVERVRRERQERMAEQAREAELRSRQEAGRRAAAERRRHEEERREAESLKDEEAFDEGDEELEETAAPQAAEERQGSEPEREETADERQPEQTRIAERQAEEAHAAEETAAPQAAEERQGSEPEREKTADERQPEQTRIAERQAEEARAAERERAEAETRARERAEAETLARERAEAEARERLAAEAAERAKREAMATRRDETVKEAEPTASDESFLQQLLRRAKERVQGGALPERAPLFHVESPQPMKLLEVESIDTGGTLIFSDSPEYIKQPGILYTDIAKGDTRVFYYHLNDTKKKYKVAVVLESVGGQYAVVRVTRRAIAEPSTDYYKVGKGLQQAYFSDAQGTEKRYIASGERCLLLDTMDKTVLRPGELVSGMVDFTASAPIRATVLCYPADKNPLEYVDKAEVLAADEHRMRGTFIGMDRILRLERYDPEEDGVACVVLADGERDKYHEGVDATDGSLVTNMGNYGVLYRIEASSPRRARYFVSPMGGAFAGALRVEAGAAETKLVNVPDGRSDYFGAKSLHPLLGKKTTTTLTASAELSELGVYRAKPSLSFEFSPPGASNLPVLLILAPEDLILIAGQNFK